MKARYTGLMHYRYTVFLGTVLSCVCVQAKELIQLQKILFNQVPESALIADEKRIELGSLTFYFSERPVIHTLPQEGKEASHKIVFFIPQVEVSDAALRKTISKMQHTKNNVFQVLLEEAKYPVKGMTLTLTFDPEKVAYSYDIFDSISLSPGVVFTFYNRALMQNLSAKASDKSLLRMACSEKKKTVVLDCGHGGMDKGAAPFKGVEEKNVTLAIGLKVADLLKKKGVDVVLTRAHDVTRALDERADIALRINPALFVSLHANASLREAAQGLETFYVNVPLLKNVRSTLQSDERHLADTVFMNRCSLSADCAKVIHADLMKAALGKNPSACDRGVKQSLAYVLLGSRVPAVLVEMGFVSNKEESRLLLNKQYQEKLAHGISSGIITALDRLGERTA